MDQKCVFILYIWLGSSGISIVDTQPDIQIPSFKNFFKDADKFLGEH